MLVKVNSAASLGLETMKIVVEINIASRGLPRFDIVGLANRATSESRHRLKAAFSNSGLDFPSNRKITINLAPADVPKDGSFYDLPIAAGLISLAYGLKIPKKSLFFGEVSLDGSLRHTKGAFLFALFAKENGYKNLFVPESNDSEVSSLRGFNVFPLDNLNQLVTLLQGGGLRKVPTRKKKSTKKTESFYKYDMQDVIGQIKAKRTLEIAAAGGHNLLMMGPPGSGKTLLAKTFRSILPPMEQKEALEVTKIYSAAGSIPPGGSLIEKRPFRAPHHTISYAGMVGGGSLPKPGQISLAHRGVLFMDEFPEFPRSILEMLRQPLEEGKVTISRSRGTFSFPCRFILIASGNPCPCGFFGSAKTCTCTPGQIRRYKKKLSGPIMDRIDLFIRVRAVKTEKLQDSVHSLGDKRVPADVVNNRETSKEIRKRVTKARSFQKDRFKKLPIFSNAEMLNKHIKDFCRLERPAQDLLESAVDLYSLSARSYFKVLKVSRTIADLAASEVIREAHVAEAVQYRYRED